jgi:threonine-phosphate decarboxylase
MSAIHGGDVEAVARQYGVDATTLIDFSANIAPSGPPKAIARVLEAFASRPRALAPYPGASYDQLRSRIAEIRGVEPESVALGHGSAALIDAAVRATTATTWLVPTPAFSEYRRALRSAGTQEHSFPLPPDFALDVDVVLATLRMRNETGLLINTPHNPSGFALEHQRALELLDGCCALRRPVIVDEAFIDYIPERSVAREAVRSQHAIVLQSLTKFYALAGVRVGYALAHPNVARRMREIGTSWPVGTLDEAIALEALADEEYAARTREQNVAERTDLAERLGALGLRVLPSVANFLFVELPTSAQGLDAVLAALIDDGIVVRDCRTYEGLEHRAAIRVAVLDQERNRALAHALARVSRLF